MKATRQIVAAVAVLMLGVGCSKTVEPTAQTAEPVAAQASSPHAGVDQAMAAASSITGAVVETMDSGGYTYVLVDRGEDQVWAATPQFAVSVGDEVTVHAPSPMPNYHSKTLDRTFDVVYFAPSITPAGASPAASPMASGHPGGPISAPSADVDIADIEKAAGGHTVGEVFANKADLAGSDVAIRGKVVKFNAGIMGKNWLHIQDGSGKPGENDLTVTTDASASVGDTVVVRGKPVLDKDFGYGYKYALIIEDAEITIE